MKQLLLAALWLIALPASPEESALVEFESWALELEVDQRIVAGILDFSHRGESLSQGHATKLAADLRRLVVQESSSRLRMLEAGGQAPFINVDYPKPGFADLQGQKPTQTQEREFEKSFVRTEVIAFFEGADMSPQAALGEYTKPDFRKLTSSQLKEITQENGLLCVETTGVSFILDPTLSCNRVHELHRPGLSAQHSQVVSNPGGGDFQKVYFKESLKVFLTTPTGLALYYINFSRTTDLGRMRKYVGRGKIIQSQQRAIDELQLLLRAG